MLLVRTHIGEHHQELRRILAGRNVRRLLGELQGDELTRAPKGFDPNHPAIELIKMKDWILDTNLDASLSTTPRLYREVADRFRVGGERRRLGGQLFRQRQAVCRCRYGCRRCA